MRAWYTTLVAAVIAALVAVAVPGHGQQITTATPFRSMRDSFFENNSINWSGNYRGINFSFGAPGQTTPQFGSPNTSAGLSANFGILGKNGQVFFNTNFSQGYRQSLVTQTPSVTTMNGQTGTVSDMSLTPFVISAIPVVGAFPAAPPPLRSAPGIEPDAPDSRVQAFLQAHSDAQAQAAAKAQAAVPNPPQPLQADNNAPRQRKETLRGSDPIPAPPDPGEAVRQRLSAAQESTAGRPALSVAEAKRLHQQEQASADGEMAALMERARALEEDGKPSVAKIYYQRVAKHATGELQQQARTRLYDLQGSGKP
jgi:hypothetical protein